MTPKEKADELIDKMYYICRYDDKEDYNPAMAWKRAKQCALIAVEEILTRMIGSRAYSFNEKLFWSEVKSELQSL